MEQERRDAEALRQRLYRPGASTEDLDSYLGAAVPEEPEAQRAWEAQHEHPVTASAPAVRVEPQEDRSAPPRTRWPYVLLGAGAVAVLAGAAVAVGALAPAPTPTASTALPSADAGWTSAPRDPGDALVPTVIVDGGRRAHATGRAVPAVDQGWLYTTAPGDTVTAIAARFRLCTADVLVALPYGADPTRLPPEQRILLERGAVVAASSAATPGAC